MKKNSFLDHVNTLLGNQLDDIRTLEEFLDLDATFLIDNGQNGALDEAMQVLSEHRGKRICHCLPCLTADNNITYQSKAIQQDPISFTRFIVISRKYLMEDNIQFAFINNSPQTLLFDPKKPTQTERLCR
jgi:hypothetical protein